MTVSPCAPCRLAPVLRKNAIRPLLTWLLRRRPSYGAPGACSRYSKSLRCCLRTPCGSSSFQLRSRRSLAAEKPTESHRSTALVPSFRSPAGGLYPRSHGLSGLLRDLELHGTLGLLLHDDRARGDSIGMGDILTRSFTRSQALNLLSMVKSNRARSRV